MKLTSQSFTDGARIPGEFAFCIPAAEGHVCLGANRNPQLAWADVPAGTKSFVLICHDPDVPSKGDDVNKEGRSVPASLPRVDFFHWVRRALQNEVAQLRREVAMGGKGAGPEAKEINGIKLIAQVLTGVSGKDLPALVDEMKARIGSGAVLLIADTGAKPAVAAGVTADLTDRLSAVTLVKAAAEALGGKGGGGRPDLAQSGGADIGQAEAAIKAAEAAMGG